MARREKFYRRLPGRPLAAFVHTSLWTGPDHVIKIVHTNYNEDYKRYYFRDIQAFIIRRNGIGAIWNAIFGVIALLGLVGLASGLAAGETAVSSVTVAITIIFFFLLAINFLRGPTCDVFLKTAVQTDRLASLTRVGSARRVLEMLRPKILAAQQDLPATEEFEESPDEPPPTGQLGGTGEIQYPPEPAITPPPPPMSRLARTLLLLIFGILLLSGALAAISFFVNIPPLGMMRSFLLLATLGLIVVALVRMPNHAVVRPLRLLLFVSLAYIALAVAVGYVYMVYEMVRLPGMESQFDQLIMHIHRQSVWDSPFLFITRLIGTVVCLVLGMLGLIDYRRVRRVETASGVSPANAAGETVRMER